MHFVKDDFSLITLMVEETMSMENGMATIPFDIDSKRQCFIFDLNGKLEIPFNFGPFKNLKGQKIILDSTDEYVFPYFKEFFSFKNPIIEINVDSFSFAIYEDDMKMAS